MKYQLSDRFVTAIKNIVFLVIVGLIAILGWTVTFLNHQVQTLNGAISSLSQQEQMVKTVITSTASPSATPVPTVPAYHYKVVTPKLIKPTLAK